MQHDGQLLWDTITKLKQDTEDEIKKITKLGWAITDTDCKKMTYLHNCDHTLTRLQRLYLQQLRQRENDNEASATAD